MRNAGLEERDLLGVDHLAGFPDCWRLDAHSGAYHIPKVESVGLAFTTCLYSLLTKFYQNVKDKFLHKVCKMVAQLYQPLH